MKFFFTPLSQPPAVPTVRRPRFHRPSPSQFPEEILPPFAPRPPQREPPGGFLPFSPISYLRWFRPSAEGTPIEPLLSSDVRIWLISLLSVSLSLLEKSRVIQWLGYVARCIALRCMGKYLHFLNDRAGVSVGSLKIGVWAYAA